MFVFGYCFVCLDDGCLELWFFMFGLLIFDDDFDVVLVVCLVLCCFVFVVVCYVFVGLVVVLDEIVFDVLLLDMNFMFGVSDGVVGLVLLCEVVV